MKKLLLIALLAGFIALTGSYQNVQAQDFGPPDEGGYEHRGQGGHGGENLRHGGMHKKGMRGKHGGKQGFMKMMKDLNLTEEQKEQLKTSKEGSKEKMKALREQMKSERENFMTLMSNVNSTKQELMAQQNKMSSLKSQMAELRIDGMIAFKQVLTPEQLAQFQQKMSEKHAKMKERMQQRKGMQGRQGRNGDHNRKSNY